MTTRKGTLIAAVVLAVLPLASGAAVAQQRTDDRFMPASRQSTHCEGAYDSNQGTNFGICYSSAVSGESKSMLGALPESGGGAGTGSD